MAEQPANGKSLRELTAAMKAAQPLIDAFHNSICLLAPDGRILACNRATRELLGKSEDELESHHCHELFHHASLRISGCPFTLARNRLRPEFIDMVFADHWFRATVTPILERGEFRGAIHFLSDITEHKQASAQSQEALRRSEERYRTLFDGSPVAMGELEATGLLRFLEGLRGMSPEAAEALIGPAGARRAEARRGVRLLELNKAGLRFFRLPDSVSLAGERLKSVEDTLADILLTDYRCLLDGKMECGGEAAVAVSPKEMRSILWRWTDTKAGAGAEPRYMVSLLDVTERERAEEALREREESLRALYENSMVGILLASPEGRTFAANPAACRILGRTEAELCRLSRAIGGRPLDPRIAALRAERDRTGSASGEVTLTRGDGTRFPAEIASALFQTAEGPRVCTVIQDLSGRRAAEEQTRELTRRLLTVREEEKRRLSAALHHDVGSMTVGVTARMQAAEEDLRAGKTGQALDALRECRALFDRSVERLKALAVELRPPDLDVLGLSAALRQILAQVSRDTPLRIRFTDATRGRTVQPDVQTVLFRVAQASLNNVVEHAEAHRVIMRLSAGRRGMRLFIRDDGKGFDLSNAAVPPGTNMGLRAVREMVTGQGGQMTVESAPGKGTTVRVVVPAE